MEFKSLKELVRIVENGLAVQFYGVSGQTNVLRKTVLKVLAAVLCFVILNDEDSFFRHFLHY